MGTCPECDATLDGSDGPNVEYVAVDGLSLAGTAPKEFYLIACENCRKAIATSVSAAAET